MTPESAGDNPWLPDTRPRRRGCLTRDLASAAANAASRWPDSTLVRNGVGNLSIMDSGLIVGYLDLTFGTVHAFDAVPDTRP